MAKGCTICGGEYHTKTFCYKNPNSSIARSKLDSKSKPCEWCSSPFHLSSTCWSNPKTIEKRQAQKTMHCTHCDELGHTRSECQLLKLHKAEKLLLNVSKEKVNPHTGRYPDLQKLKEINKSGKYARRWKYTRRLWILQNPPNHQGYYTCHYCVVSIPMNEMTLDHKQSRSRHPELRYELSNLVPCCDCCNGRKGSRSHDEFCTVCSVTAGAGSF